MTMKTLRIRNSALCLTLLAAAVGCGSAGASAAQATSSITPSAPPMTPAEGSYDVGLMLGSQLQHNGAVPVLSIDDVIRGLKDAVGGRAITAAEREAALRFMRDARETLAERNKAAGREFLARNARQPGVKTMPSGLQYQVLAEGDAKAKPALSADDVTVRYRASLADGTEIDRSDAHDRPATFRVNTVFKGWQDAFLAMRPGANWRLFVPPELGYGSNPPPTVPPGALLIYDIELLRIDRAPPMDPNAGKGPPARGNPAATDPAASH
jgi:FKBP-type peptidyl-prolyl cis-trans isomerase FklB